MRVRPLATAPGPLQVCESPLSDVTMSAFIQVENILKICYELWFKKNNKNKTLIKKCVV